MALATTRGMRKLFIILLFTLAAIGYSRSANAQGYFGSGFGYSSFGTTWTAMPRHSIYRHASPAAYDAHIDPALVRAARIADQRAAPHSMLRCWHYVKDALVSAGAVNSRPTTAYAKEAGEELVRRHGFVQLRTRNPYKAPVGAVIVYSGHGAGHVELRTARGFASDYRSSSACNFHVIGIYAKMSS